MPSSTPDASDLIDLHPAVADLRDEAIRGLTAEPKTLPCKLFYDEVGAKLFEEICEQPEYYLTRVETSILEASMDEIVACLGPQVQLIEPGSGAGTKTRLLLSALDDPVAYVPIDISKEHLRGVADAIRRDYPGLEVQAVCADFSQEITAPEPTRTPKRRIVYFPGSTIGNFEADEARAFLGRMADLAGPGGGLLIGFDRQKEVALLEAAYDDAAKVTAAFNKNALVHLNAEAQADFDLDAFEHEARWNDEHKRIEMHLRSTKAQQVTLGDETIPFAEGETIHTESCHKYGPDGVVPLTDRFEHVKTWTDPEDRFGIQFLAVRA